MKQLQLDDQSMPGLGFGTFGLSRITGRDVARNPLACGYRQIDTARMYDNEMRAVSGLARNERRVDAVWAPVRGS